ncbi:MAG: hypothetical protein C0391_03855 [Anaerolinea sp.]|nr:hypothetical protein [Anaerolinea sp.]
MKSASQVSLEKYVDAKIHGAKKASALAARSIEIRVNLMTEEIKILRSSKDKLEGKASQNQVFIAYAISIVGLVIGLIGIFK